MTINYGTSIRPIKHFSQNIAYLLVLGKGHHMRALTNQMIIFYFPDWQGMVIVPMNMDYFFGIGFSIPPDDHLDCPFDVLGIFC
jgi:hypothetical protein